VNEKRLLIIFIKNPELGKVKTRLAASIGDQKALEVYLHLLKHTANLATGICVDKTVFYADQAEENDLFESSIFKKEVQVEGDLGVKMNAAFEQSFQLGYNKVIIIGSDCLELTADDLERAFELLETNDVVLGPAVDGGYYLIGLKKAFEELFNSKPWSTDQVLELTINDIKQAHKTFALLDKKRDIDTLQDLQLSAISWMSEYQ
jgi:rSAM/selenodomain-associated transferase 1